MLRFSTAGESHGESARRPDQRAARGSSGRPGVRRPRAVAPPAGLRPRRPHAHREGRGPHPLRRAPRQDHRLAHRHDARQQRLEELDRNSPRRSGRSVQAQSRRQPAPRPRRPRRRLKYDFKDARYVLERASARETAARVACGAIAKLLLRALGVDVASHVIRVGKARTLARPATLDEIVALASARKKSCSTASTPSAKPR